MEEGVLKFTSKHSSRVYALSPGPALAIRDELSALSGLVYRCHSDGIEFKLLMSFAQAKRIAADVARLEAGDKK